MNIIKTCFTLVKTMVLLMFLQGTALAYESPLHVFSTNDVMGGFDGSTYGSLDGASIDNTIICGLIPEVPCPADNGPILDKSGVMLYPVDSEFGYYIVDFLGAQGKTRDGDYLEGLVGDIEEEGVHIGIMISNAATDTYKVKAPMGTWCAGLGGTSVKCETEHYSVMEHINSCHETLPYLYADPVTGAQAILSTPDGSLTFDCGGINAHLDDNTLILVDGLPTVRLTDPTPCDAENDPVGCQMFPNDKTSTQDNVAIGSDYSVQLKDDGKPLYGWGGLHKRPNDIRMYARLQLPDEWKAEGADFVVTRAELIINHLITNNPNDQLRPEDLENEAATGRKPSYRIEGTIGGADEVWKSLEPCYEGDGDIIDNEDGFLDPTFLDVGTYLKNMPFALDPAATPGDLREDPPYAFSSDLYKGLTNAFYTTLNRDPFEWSYDANPDPMIQDFVGSALPDDTLGELVSGPRWRLKPNKFGQDLPGLEVPLIECSPPPFQHDNIKYVVGEPVTTVINLLDWADENSPLATSKGWVDVTANEFVTVVDEINGIPITSNGLPMSNDFDLAVYVKGDRKATAVYNAQLIIEYEGEAPPTDFDLALSALEVPDRVLLGEEMGIHIEVTNNGPAAASGTVTLTAVTLAGTVEVSDSFTDLAAGDVYYADVYWHAPERPQNITWTAVVSTEGGDTDPDNDVATAITRVRRF